MFARIGVLRALNRHVERVFNPARKESSLGSAEAGAGAMKTIWIYVDKASKPATDGMLRNSSAKIFSG
jgi:hypothetical protein